MDQVDLLRVFVHVADMRSFIKTAKALNLPRATVSLAVQQLEQRMGARLLHRTTRLVQLTPDGQTLLERSRSWLADADAIDGLFRKAPTEIAGRLSVDVPSRIARRLVAPALPAFFERYPNVQVMLGSTDRPIDLVQEGVDCAIRVGPLDSTSLVARPLGALTLINCASPAYMARHGVPNTPEDLPKHWAIDYASAGGARIAAWEYRNGEQTINMPMRSRVTVNNAETYIACCLSGLGLIQIPRYDVQEHLEAGELVEVLPAWRAAPMQVSAIYPHWRHRADRVEAFVSWLISLLQSRFD
jgi:DNA-binding transcriptional LysR family regulator